MGNANVFVDKNKIYAVKMADEKKAYSLALYVDPAFRDFKGICFYTPGERGHMIEGRLGEKTDTGFTFISEGYAPGLWTFTEVTYENFKNEYHKIVECGSEILERVSTTQELVNWYHDSFPRR